MMSAAASFSLHNHRASTAESHSTRYTPKESTSNRRLPQHPENWKKEILSRRLKEIKAISDGKMSDLISRSCEARLMPSQRSWSLLLHTGGGTNWCTLGAMQPRWARLDARSSLWTSGTFRTSASSSPSEGESHADFWELKNSLSQRRMMFGDGDLTSCSSFIGGLGLEMAQCSMVILETTKNRLCHFASRSKDMQNSFPACANKY